MKIYTEQRPWGSFTEFTHNEISTVKIINVKAGEQLSLQYHHKRQEFWRVLEGNPTILIGETHTLAQEGDEFTIQKEEKHRIAAGDEPVQILEISTGEFDEDDIVRLDDKYGRA